MLITEYHRNLPHIQYVGATFFVTFNLRGAMPAEVIARLVGEKERALKRIRRGNDSEGLVYAEQKRHLSRVDRVLDACQYGEDWLKQPQVAAIVAAKLHEYDGRFYDLLAYCIMSNHVHLVIDLATQLDTLGVDDIATTANYTQLHSVLKRIKGGSSLLMNRLLGRNGAFWQPESYDHYVRNNAELVRIINYVLQNPVRAGLVENWQDWPYTYVSDRCP